MSFTRFHDDSARIKKQNEESSFLGRYMLNMPGPGSELPYFEDPQVRLQKWGANLQTNTVGVESDLRGLTRRHNRDHIDHNQHAAHSVSSSASRYASAKPFVEESRASHPAWMYKDLEQPRWENPLLNPLNGLEKTFDENIQTRLLEKDHYITQVPVVAGQQGTHYYLAGPSVCIGGHEDTCFGSPLVPNRPPSHPIR